MTRQEFHRGPLLSSDESISDRTSSLLILAGRPGFFHRVDSINKAQRWTAAVILIGSFAGAGAFFASSSTNLDPFATILVFSLGLSGYLFTNAHSRHIQVTEYAQKTLNGLQSRWDQLRTDPTLLRLLTESHEESSLTGAERLIVRLYFESLLEEFAMIIHYIRRGYFRHTVEFAQVYERMIDSLFDYPFFQAVWLDQSDRWGCGRVRDAFGQDLVRVVDHCASRDHGAISSLQSSPAFVKGRMDATVNFDEPS